MYVILNILNKLMKENKQLKTLPVSWVWGHKESMSECL